MPTLRNWALTTPDKLACVIAGTDEAITYRDLDQRSNAVAQLILSVGLVPGDGIAIMLENDLEYFEIAWGARRAGMYYTPISTHLKPDEATFIIRDSGAKILFTVPKFESTVEAVRTRAGLDCTVLVVHGTLPDTLDYSTELAAFTDYVDLGAMPIGNDFFYSSGTTGRPKGIKQPMHTTVAGARSSGNWVRDNFAIDDASIYLSTAPLYHGAPLRYTMLVLDSGGTNVVMRKFAADRALDAIQTYRVTHSQWVPTMFFRLLALPDAVRSAFDLSSHRCAIHAAAPCPVEIKERMIDWWGPIIWEYYAGSEKNGATCISSAAWLTHRGSVGRACLGTLHILDSNQNELEPGEIGDVYFDGPTFIYHNDPEKTAAVRSKQGWSTLGDVGYLDVENYLYLTDRRSHMIISGGVNIYPVEIENVLLLHPAVRDAAVFGIKNEEFGQEVKAVVQLNDGFLKTTEVANSISSYCRDNLSSVKCPRTIDFEDNLPRQENGKLFKHELIKRYL